MMRWFGEPWGARICDTTPRAETPVGGRCFLCPAPIGERDAGFILPRYTTTTSYAIAHRGCFILSLLSYENGTVPTPYLTPGDGRTKTKARRSARRDVRDRPARPRRRQPAAKVLEFPVSRVRPSGR
jgi:hypothetical protein